jgi:Holliday junction resolvase RusA-like endonuclease
MRAVRAKRAAGDPDAVPREGGEGQADLPMALWPPHRKELFERLASSFSGVGRDPDLILILPWPPSVNDYKVADRRRPGVYYLTSRAKKFREVVFWLCAGKRRFAGEVEMAIELYRPDARKYDVDNWVKSVLDGLQHGLILKDDAQVMALAVAKCGIAKGGSVVVRIWERAA